MADIKTTHTMDRFSPLGKYIYQAAQTSGKYVAHYRTNAFVDVRISSAYITQYASHGNKIERPTIEISGEVHGVSGIFSDILIPEYELPLLFVILIVVVAIAAVIGCFFLKWAIELWLWKTVIMAIFTSAPALTFWQMAGIDIIASCLFGTRVVKTESNKK